MEESKFLRIRCPRCSNGQVVFGKSSTAVKCHVCNASLVRTRGGKAQIRAEVKEVL